MGKILSRTVSVLNRETGEYDTYLGGTEAPDFLDDGEHDHLFANQSSALRNRSAEELAMAAEENTELYLKFGVPEDEMEDLESWSAGDLREAISELSLPSGVKPPRGNASRQKLLEFYLQHRDEPIEE